MPRDEILKRPKPPVPEEYIDWVSLEREFIFNTKYTTVQTWLREVMQWPVEKCMNGNTLEKTTGWGKKRASFQQNVTAEAMAEYRQLEKERAPQLLAAKMNLVAEIINDVKRWDKLNAKDKKLIYEILKYEMGEAPGQIPGQSDLPPVALVEFIGDNDESDQQNSNSSS